MTLVLRSTLSALSCNATYSLGWRLAKFVFQTILCKHLTVTTSNCRVAWQVNETCKGTRSLPPFRNRLLCIYRCHNFLYNVNFCVPISTWLRNLTMQLTAEGPQWETGLSPALVMCAATVVMVRFHFWTDQNKAQEKWNKIFLQIFAGIPYMKVYSYCLFCDLSVCDDCRHSHPRSHLSFIKRVKDCAAARGASPDETACSGCENTIYCRLSCDDCDMDVCFDCITTFQDDLVDHEHRSMTFVRTPGDYGLEKYSLTCESCQRGETLQHCERCLEGRSTFALYWSGRETHYFTRLQVSKSAKQYTNAPLV
jgi:hypothetical protein